MINPDNLLILLQHLRCAAFELPFAPGEGFGKLDPKLFEELMTLMEQAGYLHGTEGRYYWVSANYPADQISLRSTSAQPIVLQEPGRPLGHDGEWLRAVCSWMVHQRHLPARRKVYQIEELDWDQHVAHLAPVQEDTTPKRAAGRT